MQRRLESLRFHLLASVGEFWKAKNMKDKILVLEIMMLVITAAGCGTKTAARQEPVCVQDVQPDVVAEAAEDVLVDMGFDIEKYDVDAGYISTYPLRSKQFFEFWRGDTAGKKAKLASNLHTERRTVEMNISESDRQLCVDCTVIRERLSVPGRQAGGPEDSFGGISRHTKMGTEESLALEDDFEDIRWENLGKDEDLRAKILARINKKLEK